jgi:hypothetical protein
MSTPKTKTTGAEHQEKTTDVHHFPIIDEKGAIGKVTQVSAASVALAAAVAARKPSLLSKNMLKLYFIMGVGYLVSTMNGFGGTSLILSLTSRLMCGRFFSHGIYQCYDPIPKEFWTQWCGFKHRSRLHHLQSRTNCGIPVLRIPGRWVWKKSLHFCGMFYCVDWHCGLALLFKHPLMIKGNSWVVDLYLGSAQPLLLQLALHTLLSLLIRHIAAPWPEGKISQPSVYRKLDTDFFQVQQLLVAWQYSRWLGYIWL